MRTTLVALVVSLACNCATVLGSEPSASGHSPKAGSEHYKVTVWSPTGPNTVTLAPDAWSPTPRTPVTSAPARSRKSGLQPVTLAPVAAVVPIPLVKPHVRRQPPREAICGMIEAAAREHALPVRFLTRLIWQESRFKVSAVSHAGARGIAQFMPATAAERDLRDPFDPKQALWAAAGLLGSLKQRFGNLGLAAAAYNAGPGRVTEWLNNKRLLPQETRHYVWAITGRPARSWAEPAGEEADLASVSMFADDTADGTCASVVVAMAADG